MTESLRERCIKIIWEGYAEGLSADEIFDRELDVLEESAEEIWDPELLENWPAKRLLAVLWGNGK